MRIICIALCFVMISTFSLTAAADGAQCASCRACAATQQIKNSPVDCSSAKEPAGNGALRKLGRGFANAFGWPTEIFNQMCKANSNGGPLAAMTWGLASGIGMAAVRCVVGFYEFATFAIPVPPGYEPILDDPELFFRDEAF